MIEQGNRKPRIQGLLVEALEGIDDEWNRDNARGGVASLSTLEIEEK